MQSPQSRNSQATLLLGDLVLLNLSFILAGVLRFHEIHIEDTAYYDYYVQLFVFVNLLWFLLSMLLKTYNTGLTLEPRLSVSKTLSVFFWHLFLLLLLLFSLKKGEYSRLFLVYFYAFSFVSILPWHFFFLRFRRMARRKGNGFRQVVLVGEGQRLQAFINTINAKPELAIKVVATFSDNALEGKGFTQYQAQEVYPFLEEYHFSRSEDLKLHEIYVALEPDDEQISRIFYLSEFYGLRYRVLPDLGIKFSRHIQIDFFDEVPVITLRQEPLEYYHLRAIKRAFDLLFCFFVIVCIAPWLFPLLAIGVKLSGKGPILFAQKRHGHEGAPFTIYKFRSMVPNAEAHQRQAVANDARITRFGRFIRRHHLDELPQIYNILIGEMSVIGPRPHMLEHTEKYNKLIRNYMLRHFVKPGITGLSQVRGLKGEHSLEEMKQRVKTDVYYTENWSLLLDISILLRTLGLVIKGDKKV